MRRKRWSDTEIIEGRRDIGEMIGQSFQNIHGKKNRGSLTAAELFQIADVLGAEVKFVDKKTGKILV